MKKIVLISLFVRIEAFLVGLYPSVTVPRLSSLSVRSLHQDSQAASSARSSDSTALADDAEPRLVSTAETSWLGLCGSPEVRQPHVRDANMGERLQSHQVAWDALLSWFLSCCSFLSCGYCLLQVSPLSWHPSWRPSLANAESRSDRSRECFRLVLARYFSGSPGSSYWRDDLQLKLVRSTTMIKLLIATLIHHCVAAKSSGPHRYRSSQTLTQVSDLCPRFAWCSYVSSFSVCWWSYQVFLSTCRLYLLR